MAARYSYSNPYQVNELAMYEQQLMMHQSGARRFFSAIGRFFYRLIVLTLIIGTVGGVLFALYKNDVLLQIARGAGIETQFKSFESAIGAKGWGPRTVEPPSGTDPITAAAAPAADAANPSEKQGETVRAAVTSEPKAATADGVAIVSFDSLPTASKAKAETVDAEPAKAARSEPMTIGRAAAMGPSRPAPKPKAEKPKPAKPTELTRSIPLPKEPPKPEPVAAKPEPKPEPPPKPVVEEDHTKPRAGDNPLKAAIRASMAGKKPE
jgi:hypothetical protein